MGISVRTGRPPQELIAELGLSAEVFQDPDAQVPHDLFERCWELGARLTADADFGLSIAEMIDGAPMDSLDFVTWYAATLSDMMSAFVRYQRLVHTAAASVVEPRGDTTAMLLRLEGCEFTSRHPPSFIVATWLMRMRRATGVRIRPRRVCFRAAPPADPSRVAKLFDAPIVYGSAENGLELERETLALPIVHANPALRESWESHALRRLAEHDAPSDEARWMTVFRGRLTEAIVCGDPTMERVAELLHASTRTLQRRLQDGGTSFREQLDAVRRELATAKLREAGSVTDVAFLLGFSDVTAFTRAFRRWTGTTPGRYLREAEAT